MREKKEKKKVRKKVKRRKKEIKHYGKETTVLSDV